MSKFVEKMITHNFCINNIEEVPEDKTVLKFKAVVMHFEKSHNGWAISKNTAEKYMHTLINKHIVARYYEEDENDGVDAFGSHEEGKKKLRGSNGEVYIPTTHTHSLGTITKVYIGPESDESDKQVLWCEGILLAWDNINECSLLLEWSNNGIPILVSVEWYYSENMIDNDNVEWIVNPTFSALTILNSEQRGNKNIVLGNYDGAHIELMLNSDERYRQFNNAIIKDINKKNNRRGEVMENVFLKAMNDISFGETRSKIYEKLSEVMTAKEYEHVYIGQWDIYTNYFLYENYENNESWTRFKVEYVVNEDDSIDIKYDTKTKVERKQIFVEVAESEAAVNEAKTLLELSEAKANELDTKVKTLEDSIVKIKKENELLKECESKLNEINFEQKLNEKKEVYREQFASFNAVEKFDESEIQELIKGTLDSENSINSVVKLQDILLECARNSAAKPQDESEEGKVNHSFNGHEPSSKLGSLVVKPVVQSKNMVDKYGIDVEI